MSKIRTPRPIVTPPRPSQPVVTPNPPRPHRP
jgi:hypothetical protein